MARNAHRRTAIAFVALAFCAALSSGCGDPTLAESALRPRPPRLISISGEAASLSNPGFEEWSASGPSGWLTQGEPRPTLTPARADARQGKVALEAGPGHAPFFLAQEVRFRNGLAGAVVRVEAQARTAVPEGVACSIWAGRGRHASGAPHPGDGAWRPVACAYRFPENWPHTECLIRFDFAQGSGAVLLDDVALEVERP